MYDRAQFLTAGDRALVVEYGDTIDQATNRRARTLAAALLSQPVDGLLEVVPTYRSVLIHYDPLRLPKPALERVVLDVERYLADVALPAPRVIEVPVVYGGQYGPDLQDVAALSGLPPDEVVAIHCGQDYLVYMMGFMAGFPYLGGLSPRISVPRLASPRTKVPTGSVAVALEQTGIYPTETPGGWRLIGWTPVRVFDATREPPVFFEAGDYIRFIPVSEEQALVLGARVLDGTWAPTVRPRG